MGKHNQTDHVLTV